MEYDIEKYAMLIIKSRKQQTTEGIELPNQNKIRTLGEKETYKYLGLFQAATIEQAEGQERIKKKNTTGEQGNYSKPNYIA